MAQASLYGGSALAQWIRRGGRPQRRVAAHAAKLAWHAFWFERNWQAQMQRLGPLALPDDPVFILGLWRSGTTVFHELLAACADWITPRTWQCFNPSTCFLTAAPSRSADSMRPMDQGRISTFSPQEDEFALMLLGEPSAYLAFIDPRRFDECAQLLQRNEQSAPPRWQHFLRGLSGPAAGADTGGAAPLLLKSPGHTFRVPALLATFPRARFIWVARRSGEVVASNLKMWGAMMERYALWSCPHGALESFLDTALGACAAVLERCLEEMPQERMLWVEFDELRADARAVLERTRRFLGAGQGRPLGFSADDALERIRIHSGASLGAVPSRAIERLDALRAAARGRFSHD